ncbi:DUF5937 family protein [Nocardiopsis sp. NPDC058789]|uniref:Winged helix-turn-helix transcriptional regulator n=1 Tax=Nocardiopsis eucommiae TaxID=2831970 RepID=A0A975L863_9ACTN|nr:winged helix-turn-helix transcriptional regulator [Nocardiopsis eucommiae]
MPIVFDLVSTDASRVVVRPSPLAELMAFLHSVAEPGHHPGASRDIRAVRSGVDRATERRLRTFAPLWARFRLRALLPLDTSHPATFQDELALMNAMPAPVFDSMVAETIASGSWERYYGLRDPDDHRAEFLEVCRAKSEEREELGELFLADRAAFRQNLSDLLQHCHDTFFRARWEATLPQLSTAEREVRGRFSQDRLGVVLASLTPGGHYLPQTAQVAYDKLQNAFVSCAGRDLVLVPSLFTRPHLVVKFEEAQPRANLPIVVQFPITELGTTDVPLRELQHRMAVLSDPARLVLCRHLVNEHCTTGELATRVGMTEPQVSRHLRRLREAGLLESVRDGRLVRHRIRLGTVYSLGHQFLTRLVQ